MSALILPVVVVVALLTSVAVDRSRTVVALRIAWRRFVRILLPFLSMLSLAAVALTLVSPEWVSVLLSGERLGLSTLAAAVLGSVALVPGFIAFPLAGILLGHGVPHTVLAGFTVTLMLVGVATFPIERAYFGGAVTVVRNGICFVIALLVAVVIGIAFGEIG